MCFTEGIDILVGNNESGKSTVLETAHMALSGIFRGKSIKNNLTQYLFPKALSRRKRPDFSRNIIRKP